MDWSARILAECSGEDLPPCQAACPLDIRVREKLRLMQEGKRAEALAVVLERCPFPGILGRICSHPCEAACTRGTLEAPVAVAALKRHLADLYPEAAFRGSPGPERPEAVAIVGGGPAGLMAACDLRIMGYRVTLFEAEDALGGALRLYLPPFRLPREVLDRETRLIKHLGAEVRLHTRLGQDLTLADLHRDFAAVFLALGAHQGLRLGLPGEDLPQVRSGLDFLRAANSGASILVGPRVAVIGGGNVALDVARTARRLGAGQVNLICLEAPEEMPASCEEVAAAASEGIQIFNRWGVKEIHGREGRVTGLILRGVSRVFDPQGRFSPLYQDDFLTTLEVDMVLVAVGQVSDLSFLGPEPSLDTVASPRLEVDPLTLMTGMPRVFAGADLVTGPRTAVEAFAAGRRAALAIHSYLQNQPLPEALPPLASRSTKLVVDTTGVPPALRQAPAHLPLEQRLAQPSAEVDQGFTRAAAHAEATRCLSCACSLCVKHCPFLTHHVQRYPFTEKELVEILMAKGEAEPLVPYSCHCCGLCRAVCPQSLDAGLACLEFRQRLCAQGKGPLPQHRSVQSFVRWGTSPYFTLSRPDPATGRARRIFFPGCSLPGYSPHLVKAAYSYLRGKLQDVGLILNCCGAPSHLLGEKEVAARVLDQVAATMKSLGAQELIAACTHCLHTLREHHPEIQVHSLYEVMQELGLPQEYRAATRGAFNIHDACGARQAPEIQEAVRGLVAGMGHGYEEMPHSRERSICCGAGGMVPAVAPLLAQKMLDFCLSEAPRDLITYCATCRARFAAAGRPALHVLELLFNPHWQQARTSRPAGSWKRWWHRWRLKRHLAIP